MGHFFEIVFFRSDMESASEKILVGEEIGWLKIWCSHFSHLERPENAIFKGINLKFGTHSNQNFPSNICIVRFFEIFEYFPQKMLHKPNLVIKYTFQFFSLKFQKSQITVF